MYDKITRRTFLKGSGLALAALSGCHLTGGQTMPESCGIKVPYSSGTELPRTKVPYNACDCHHHIYDSRFPSDAKAGLRSPDATVADYRLLQRRLGTTRNVIVQPSAYGVNNTGLMIALKEFGTTNTRGIAVVNTGVSDAELKQLYAVGVRGIRFNLVQPGGVTTMDMVQPLSERALALGWHIQVVARADQILANADILRRAVCPVVFDHMGHIPSVSHPAFDFIIGLMKTGKAWVKLSGAYILSKVGPPTYADRTAVAQGYVKAAPDKLVWGSDWPHPSEKLDDKPDDAILLDLLSLWVPDESTRNRILVDNPARLYGFAM